MTTGRCCNSSGFNVHTRITCVINWTRGQVLRPAHSGAENVRVARGCVQAGTGALTITLDSSNARLRSRRSIHNRRESKNKRKTIT